MALVCPLIIKREEQHVGNRFASYDEAPNRVEYARSLWILYVISLHFDAVPIVDRICRAILVQLRSVP